MLNGRRGILYGCIVGLATISAFVLSLSVGQFSDATGMTNWGGVFGVKTASYAKVSSTGASWHMPGCNEQRVTVEQLGKIADEDACVTEESGIELAVFVREQATQLKVYALKTKSDMRFHQVTNLDGGAFNPVLLYDGGLILASPGQDLLQMIKLADISSSVQPALNYPAQHVVSRTYELTTAAAQTIRDDAGNAVHVRRIDVSNNYNFAVVEIYGRGVGLVDLSTLKVRYVSHDKVSDYSSSGGEMRFSVSDDGKMVVVVRTSDKFAKMYFVDGSCAPGVYSEDPSCRFVDFTTDLYLDSSLDAATPYYLHFALDQKQLFMRSHKSGGELIETRIEPDWSVRQLEYLALGDSYSSGEGDIGRKANGATYYLPGTLGEDESCHVSSRSYPFLLRSVWKLDSTKMQSIACSGARLALDYFDPRTTYLGQDDRLHGMSNMKALQKTAIGQFTPGRVPQLEFVKKYQPKTITFTAGGNDIGFAGIMRYCAASFGTCNYASDTRLRDSLDSLIDMQYDNLVAFIQAVRAASPETRIFMVGYPKFFSDTIGVCSFNAVLLDMSEIRMINRGVERLNSAIKRAAADTGTYYIDIERSLQGGALCEGSRYVTGFIDAGGFRDVDNPNMFHPNAAGHIKIAASVYEQSKHPTVPSSSGAPAIISNIVKLLFSTITKATLTARGPVDIKLSTGHFAPNSTVKVGIYSEYTELATLQTDAGGGLSASVTLPAGVHPGYHVLSVTGESPQGEEVDVQQFVTVTGTNPNDIDGDGVLNSEDKCSFIPYWYDGRGRDMCAPDSMDAISQKKDTVGGANFSVEVQHDRQLLAIGSRSYDNTQSLSSYEADTEQEVLRTNMTASNVTYLWIIGGGIIVGGVILIIWLTISSKHRNHRKKGEHI